jgi:AmmeMemoRadiSam system protein A
MTRLRAFERPGQAALRVSKAGFKCVCATLILLHAGCVRKIRTDSDTGKDATGTSSSIAPSSTIQPGYSSQDRAMLLGLARQSLQKAVAGEPLPSVSPGLPAQLLAKKGCFVTLTIKGELRGCIGNILPDRPLAEAVVSNARLAALSDSRFSPVTPAELPDIDVEVSVLSTPTQLHFISADDLMKKLRPHVDGVVLKIGEHRATFLPQVWDQLPDPNDFLNHLTTKAGLYPQAWRDGNTELLIYQVEAFKESEVLRD